MKIIQLELIVNHQNYKSNLAKDFMLSNVLYKEYLLNVFFENCFDKNISASEVLKTTNTVKDKTATRSDEVSV